MTIDEFNTARNAMRKAEYNVLHHTSVSAIADLYIAASIHGLVIVPIEDMKEVPAPICGFFAIPDPETDKAVNMFIYPADQLAK